MENAILKTLIYADIFDYPLTIFEIHKWLIGRKETLRQIEKWLEKLRVKGKVERVKEYYFLTDRTKLIRKRKITADQSHRYLRKAKLAVWFLRVIPWIKLIGVSGGLAMGNADKKDDIDLFIITAKNRLWICRLLILGFLSLTGQRRRVKAENNKAAGKFCVNMLLEEDQLIQFRKDIYLAHEVLQMKVLWQKDGIYFKYLTDNEWAFKFLPNWIGNQYHVLSSKYHVSNNQMQNTKYIILNTIENLAKKFQLWYMKKPEGLERIEDGALYFHPQDYRTKVLEEYKTRIRNLY